MNCGTIKELKLGLEDGAEEIMISQSKYPQILSTGKQERENFKPCVTSTKSQATKRAKKIKAFSEEGQNSRFSSEIERALKMEF